MNKMRKITKILSGVIALSIIICSSLFVNAISLQKNSNTANIKSYLSVDLYNKIYEKLTEQSINTYSAGHDLANSEREFTDDYAGAYINDEGNLIIQFIAGKAEKYNDIVSNAVIVETIEENEGSRILSSSTKKRIANSIVTIEEQSFSFNELMEAKEKITNAFGNSGLSLMLKQETNSIDILYSDYKLTEKVKEYIQDEFGDKKSQMFNYIYDENCVEQPNKSAYPGNKIHYNHGFLWTIETRGTIGFNAYYNGKWGVVTNGHVAPMGKRMKCADGTLGTPTFSVIGGKLDVAFIPYPNGWTPTSGLLDDDYEIIYREATESELIEGGPVAKYGVTTGHTKNGRIVSISVDVSVQYDDGVKTIRDCFKYTNSSEGGDSGGPVGFGKVRSVFRLIGIHFAGNGKTGSGIKLSNIKAAYPMTVKTGY